MSMVDYAKYATACGTAAVMAAVTLLATPEAEAYYLEIGNENVNENANGVPGRGLYFTAEQTFTVSSMALRAEIATPLTVEVVIYEGGPSDASAPAPTQLAVSENEFVRYPADTGLEVEFAWHDIPLTSNFTFLEGDDYLVFWRPKDSGQSLPSDARLDLGWVSGALELDELTVKNGVGYSTGTTDYEWNTMMAYTRFDIVPEPAALALLGLAGLPLLVRRPRRVNAAC